MLPHQPPGQSLRLAVFAQLLQGFGPSHEDPLLGEELGLASNAGEEYMRQRVLSLSTDIQEDQLDEKERRALELAQSYASGWRPPDWD